LMCGGIHPEALRRECISLKRTAATFAWGCLAVSCLPRGRGRSELPELGVPVFRVEV
jgi:hypothetical protein